MKFKRLIILLAVVALCGFFPFSCKKDKCGDGFAHFQVKSFVLRTVAGNSLLTDSSVYTSGDSLYKVLNLKEANLVASSAQGFSIAGAAFACEPVIRESKEKFKEIIFKNRNFLVYNNSDTLEAGEDITELFQVSTLDTGYVAIEDYLKETPAFKEHLPLRFRLKFLPDSNVRLNFDLKIVMSDSSIHYFKNEVMKVKKNEGFF
jgi:hypothetical protein